jgi:hypothetical protein
MLISLAIIIAGSILAMFFIVVKKDMHIWLLPYLAQSIGGIFRHKPVERHLIIAVCDHFDFGTAGKYEPGEEQILKLWEEKYPPLSFRHKDSTGVNLKHTWFFAPHYHRADYLERVVALCKRGLGEVEMHLHHDHIPPFPDTSETLRKKVRDCVCAFNKYGVFCLPDGTKTFAFIHGDWALDNSRGGKYCGVNDEIRILAEEGCYADFTFPSLHESQPGKINAIYYVTDDLNKPKSYNKGVDVQVGGKPSGDLMLVQGPLGIRKKTKYGFPFFPGVEAAEFQSPAPLSLDRMKTWIKANVHVKGRPEWIFVKLHTHGAMHRNFDHNFGEIADHFFTDLESVYNNSRDGYLHYVSAREMYNIIKAAEAGMSGNPADYRDFSIPKYVYLKS